MPTTLLTVKDVAVLLKISDRIARKWVRAGIIPSFKLGDETRIHPAKLEQWLAQQAGLPVADEKRRPGRPRTDYSKTLPRDYPDVFSDKAVH